MRVQIPYGSPIFNSRQMFSLAAFLSFSPTFALEKFRIEKPSAKPSALFCYSKNAEYTAFVANRIFKMQMKMQMEKPYGLCTHTALLLFFRFFCWLVFFVYIAA